MAPTEANDRGRRFRIESIAAPLLLIAVVASSLGGWRLFRKPSFPSNWSTFAIPEAHASVRFPASPPEKPTSPCT
jgi:hypothetical protein